MKYIVVLVVLTGLVCSRTKAQPILDSTYYISPCPSWTRSFVPDSIFLQPPTEGANQMWDYSQIRPDTTHNTIYSSRIIYASGDSVTIISAPKYGFDSDTYVGTDSGFFWTESYTGHYTYRLDPPLLMQRNGMQLNDIVERQSSYLTHLNDVDWTINATYRYAGFGTLILGPVTYHNAILISSQVAWEAVYATTNKDIHLNSWYVPGLPDAVLTMGYSDVHNIVSQQDFHSRGAYFINNFPTQSNKAPQAQNISVCPQPASYSVLISVPDMEKYPLKVCILSTDGRVASKGSLESKILSLVTLPPGLYTLVVQGRTRTYRTRLVKQ